MGIKEFIIGFIKKERIKYIYKHWKIGFHLIFRTKRFGVNNGWWSTGDSMFGWSHWKRFWATVTIRPMIENYKLMKLRAGTMAHFLTDESYKLLFN